MRNSALPRKELFVSEKTIEEGGCSEAFLVDLKLTNYMQLCYINAFPHTRLWTHKFIRLYKTTETAQDEIKMLEIGEGVWIVFHKNASMLEIPASR